MIGLLDLVFTFTSIILAGMYISQYFGTAWAGTTYWCIFAVILILRVITLLSKQ